MGAVPATVTKVRRRGVEIIHVARDEGLSSAGPLLWTYVRRAVWAAEARVLDVLLDLRLGGRTRGVLRNEDLLKGISAGRDSNWYQPVDPRKFRHILAAVDLDPPVSTFLDLGAGRGRAMLLAAVAGFRRSVGVELDPDLAEEAGRNVEKWKAGRGRRSPAQLSVLAQDAVEVEVPEGPVLVFIYNSFGPTTMRAVLERLTDSYAWDPRPLWLCYLNAQHASVVAEYATIAPRARRDDWIVYELRGSLAS